MEIVKRLCHEGENLRYGLHGGERYVRDVHRGCMHEGERLTCMRGRPWCNLDGQDGLAWCFLMLRLFSCPNQCPFTCRGEEPDH